jgi:cell division protein FtsQ
MAVILAAGWWVTNSPIFDVRSVRVQGAVHLRDAQVLRLAGLGSHTNVVWLSTSTIDRRLQSDPWVVSAQVSRTLPSSITIVVRERVPVAVLTGKELLIAEDGRVLGPAGIAALPAIEGTIRGSGDHRWLAPSASLTVARGLPSKVRRQAERIAVDASGRITVTLRSGVSVIFGDVTEAQAKGQTLQAVLAWAERSGVVADYIDVHAPSAPALLPRSG